ncbi:MAG: hypothetical protein ABSE40_11570 [Candidatus Sulfotelmatobacter sp.]
MRRDKKSKSARGIHPGKPRQVPVSRLAHRSEAARERSLKALWAMRRGDTLSKAARDNGVTPRTVRKYIGAALLQDRPGGRIRAKKSDRLVRYLQIPGPHGPRDVTARGSKAASEFANYKAVVNRLLRGDRHAMDKWHGRKIAGIELVTDPKKLIEQARKDILPYSIYRSLAGGTR